MVHGTPGEGARVTGFRKVIIPLLMCVFLFGFFTGIILPVKVNTPILLVLVAIYMVIIWLAINFFDDVCAYFKGARGEEIVAVWLSAGLPHDYHVFHDFERSGKLSIDHLVVGPSGIFAVETKFWAGRINVREGTLVVDGMKPSRSPIAQANREARALSEYLQRKTGSVYDVKPVVCFASGSFEHSQSANYDKLEGVAVCNVEEITELILADEVELSPIEMERIVKLMES